MAYISKRQMAEIAATLGHRDLVVKQTVRGMWVFTCSCGARSTQTMKEAQAAGAAVHHLEKAIKQWETAGRPPLPIRRPISEGKGAKAPAAVA